MKITHTALSTTHTFEIVNKMPKGYIIWNIGENMEDGYLPICEIKSGFEINPDTLKAIRFENKDELALLRKCACRGIVDLKSASKALKLKKNIRKKELAEQAIKILETIA